MTNTWEQRKLGDIAEITMGQSPAGSTYSDYPTKHILVQGNADLKNGWVYPRIWTTQVTKQAYNGDLIMSVRAPVGAMAKTSYDVVIGRGVAAIHGNEFIYQKLVSMCENNYWSKMSCGSTFESINSNDLKSAEFSVPLEDEQSRIGSFFSELDQLITLHQRK
ncbi:type I restriction enzyme, S subunit [Granulicatella balaenopterae]|uniref:Type I restriction enzyme, S subunit n=1 Tax=Granulicatella balaenopterae TaxID=137733 RepID=A0A1H9NIL3_9LACT|nr:restriction endonuclease subunit S [Granulicatella balaenopterae]SER35814.1 type I restriction enzyme, S subunit [Granulicatella balaenopterae]